MCLKLEPYCNPSYTTRDLHKYKYWTKDTQVKENYPVQHHKMKKRVNESCQLKREKVEMGEYTRKIEIYPFNNSDEAGKQDRKIQY